MTNNMLDSYAEPNGPEHRDHEPFGENERALGVAVNRALQNPGWDGPTAVDYSKMGFTIRIDLENDPLLVDFLRRLQDATHAEETDASPLSRAERITRQVVAQTPTVDYNDANHSGRHTTLGEALHQPVMCIERALAMQAGLIMAGFNDARELSSMVDDVGTDVTVPHIDVQFTIGDEEYVAITMDSLAGSVLPMDLYHDHIAREDARYGQHTRLQPHFEAAYFEPVSAG